MAVVGSHGRTMAAEIFLGGFDSAVIQNTTKPVLVIRVKLKEKDGQMICEDVTCDPGKNALFPIDFSVVAKRAFTCLEQIVKSGGQRVTILHVQDKSRIHNNLSDKLEEFNQKDQKNLEQLLRPPERFGCRRSNYLIALWITQAGDCQKH